jgi:hypothetical protein
MRYIKDFLFLNEHKIFIKKFNLFEEMVKDKFIFNTHIFKTAKIVANKLGYKLLRYIGKGDFGYIFLLNSDKVLKITSDKREVNYVKKNLNVEKDGIITYRNIIKIPNNLIKSNSYGIILDHVDVFDNIEKNIYMEFFLHFEYFLEMIEGSVNNNMEEYINKFIDNWELKYLNDFNKNNNPFNDKKRVKFFAKKLIDFGHNLRKSDLDWGEAHADNLGWDKNKNIIFFDVV